MNASDFLIASALLRIIKIFCVRQIQLFIMGLQNIIESYTDFNADRSRSC